MKLPESLIKEIERIIKNNPQLAYMSVPEFIREAVRDKINKYTLPTHYPK